jgi:urease accessory protein
MIEISKCMPQGGGLAAALLKRAVQVSLDWDTRQKSRFDFHGPDGTHYGVFLPRGTVVRGGDVLVATDGTLIAVTAAPQPVLRIEACPDHGSPFDLLRAAYHLGNRHVPIELKPDHLKIEPDHVLAEMVEAMGLDVLAVEQSFEPESGAYAQGGHAHGHDHGHGHSHVKGHDHDHGHDHHKSEPAAPVAKKTIPIAPQQESGHVHGPHCNHGHDHH